MKKSKTYLENKIKSSTRLVFFLLFLWGCGAMPSYSQNSVLEVGIRLQKSVNLYYENGVTLQYTNDRLVAGRLYLGVSYVSSRLGSAMGSNAIKQDNYILSSTYYFRPQRVLQPFARLNTGYFYADYEAAIFDDLPNSSVLLSPEVGISIKTNFPLKVGASFGYNLITGDGMKGPGTLYPLFLQTSITWSLLTKTQPNEK